MPIKISPKLRVDIASENSIEKKDVEQTLIDKAGGAAAAKCHLCDAQLNLTSDDIEVDHDTPIDRDGSNKINNLNLAHVECNRFKKAQGSRDVRRLLRFKRFYNEKGGSLDYTGSLEFFEASPKPCKMDEKGDFVTFQFSDGSAPKVPIHTSDHDGIIYRFCFVRVPINAVFNDDDCQPRLIKINHAFSISVDLATNPLHEPPACRLLALGSDNIKLLMFDGQHKAIASWLKGEKSIVYKIYLNISREQATGLINSIQSKIKKLTLTPFELAAKLSDEYSDKLKVYEDRVGSESCSEDGFVSSLPASERASAKKEIESAVLKEIADDSSLVFTEIVEMRGRRLEVPWRLSEAVFRNKLLKELAHTAPLPGARFKGSEMQAARVRERQNIVRVLNLLYEKVFDLDSSSSENEKTRAERMKYQSAIKYVATLVRKIVINRVAPSEDAYAFIEGTPTEAQWAKITDGIDRLVSHKVWTLGFDDPSMISVNDALQKNQGVDLAMQGAGLTPGYCLKLD